MKAQVEYINPLTQTYAAKIQGYTDFVVVELLGNYQVEKGDIISNPEFKNLGKQSYRNETRACSMEVFVQDICTLGLVLGNYGMK